MRLAEFLKLKNISQTDFAEAVGTSPQMMTEVIKGRKRFSPDMAKKIVDYSGGKISLEELLFPDDFANAIHE
jgi:plasmid maintenance system antidote protein VapI